MAQDDCSSSRVAQRHQSLDTPGRVFLRTAGGGQAPIAVPTPACPPPGGSLSSGWALEGVCPLSHIDERTPSTSPQLGTGWCLLCSRPQTWAGREHSRIREVPQLSWQRCQALPPAKALVTQLRSPNLQQPLLWGLRLEGTQAPPASTPGLSSEALGSPWRISQAGYLGTPNT